MQLRLEPVTQENRLAVLSLRAGTGQEGFVETVSACLDEAAQRADWRPVAIYDGTAVVWFAMYGYFWEYRRGPRVAGQALIDAARQGRGYGRAAVASLLARLAGGIRPAGYLSERSGRQSPLLRACMRRLGSSSPKRGMSTASMCAPARLHLYAGRKGQAVKQNRAAPIPALRERGGPFSVWGNGKGPAFQAASSSFVRAASSDTAVSSGAMVLMPKIKYRI